LSLYILQRKTWNTITVGIINPLAIQIIIHNFPKCIEEKCFNLYLKEVLEIARIKEEVKGYPYKP